MITVVNDDLENSVTVSNLLENLDENMNKASEKNNHIEEEEEDFIID